MADSKKPDTKKAGNPGKKSLADTATGGLPVPKTDPATNLLIADIVVRGASKLFRKNVERRAMAESRNSKPDPDKPIDGRGIITTLGLYGATKLASRSVPGLALVTGGLLAKTLYERGKSVKLRRRSANKADNDDAEETGQS